MTQTLLIVKKLKKMYTYLLNLPKAKIATKTIRDVNQDLGKEPKLVIFTFETLEACFTNFLLLRLEDKTMAENIKPKNMQMKLTMFGSGNLGVSVSHSS